MLNLSDQETTIWPKVIITTDQLTQCDNRKTPTDTVSSQQIVNRHSAMKKQHQVTHTHHDKPSTDIYILGKCSNNLGNPAQKVFKFGKENRHEKS